VTVAPLAPLLRPGAAVRPPATVDPATRCRRWLRLTAALAGTAARSVRAPVSSARGRRRLAVCGAARLLTALGVRVEVRAAQVAWPRTGPRHVVVVADRVGWLEGLALLTAVPGLPVATAEVAGWPVLRRLVRRSGVVVLDPAGRASLPAAAGAPSAAICPVEVRSWPGGPAAGRLTWRGLAAVVAARDAVVTVQLLPALDPPRPGRPARDLPA
jgi:1-acyl-sn-glycerol-3-phosphate acyltransferase